MFGGACANLASADGHAFFGLLWRPRWTRRRFLPTPQVTRLPFSVSNLGGQCCCACVRVDWLFAWNLQAPCGLYAAHLASLAAAKSRGQRRQFQDGGDLISLSCVRRTCGVACTNFASPTEASIPRGLR